MDSQVNLAKGTFTHHFADLVKVCLGFWRFIQILEALLDFSLDVGYNLASRGQSRLCIDRGLRLNSFINDVEWLLWLLTLHYGKLVRYD